MRAKQKDASPRKLVLAVSFAAILPLSEGCAGRYPPINPPQDSGPALDGGRSHLGLADGGVRRESGPPCRTGSERIYEGGGAVPFDGELFVLESAAGSDARISISDPLSGSSTFVSIPQWGSQTVNFAGKTFTISVNEVCDCSPSWADVDLSGC